MFIRNWFNEQHSKETSKKVRAVKKIFAENGKYMGTYAPYGYRKNPENKHHLLIDENTAPIVRQIFGLRVQGKSYRAIALHLNENGIMAPRDYHYESQNLTNPHNVSHSWTNSTVREILLNETYIGSVVQGKTNTTSYKDRRLIKHDSSEWIRAENMHEPIVTREIWERAKALADKNFKPRPRKANGTVSIFSCICVCADCGYKLKSDFTRRLRKDGTYYERTAFLCGNYARSGKSACTIHNIGEDVLHEIVANQIRTHAQLIKCNEKRIVAEILRQQNAESVATQRAYQSELTAHRKRIDKLNTFIEKLYEDRVSGIVPEDFFRRQLEKYENERIERVRTAETLERNLSEIKLKSDNAGTWAKLIKQYTQLETLDSEILLLLVDKIVIGEAQIIDDKRVCEVQVFYNYVGNIDEIGGAA